MSIDMKAGEGIPKRQFVGIIFDCCNVYQRIYMNKSKTSYVGYCPRCCKKVEFKISPYGSKDRFYKVD